MASGGLRAEGLRAVMTAFRDGLRAHQEALNRLNVYPVPDGDTGTNMALTMESVLTALDGVPPEMAPTCKAIGHGALMGGRGNSGVILSQILRGLTAECSGEDEVGAATVARALRAAADGAYAAVGRPVEGTILTVVREAASSASAAAAAAGASLAGVLEEARRAGGEALARTPELLPVLEEAGVVDAGGSGFLLLLDAALHVVVGTPMPAPPDAVHVPAPAAGPGAGGHRGVADLRYEVMYLLEAPDQTIAAFKDVWAGIGDSIVVVGGDGLWNCHIHTDDVGAAIEAALDAGRPRSIRVTDLLDEAEPLEAAWVREAAQDTAPPADEVTTAVVAVSSGDGIRRILHSLGVQQVVTGGQSMNPSVAQLLEAVERTAAEQVVLLPNNKNIVPVACQVAELSAKPVAVVPTRSITEGLAALVAYDPDAGLEPNVRAMERGAASVVAAEVTVAVRDSSCEVGPIAEGDHLGITAEGIRVVATSAGDALTQLLEQLVTDDHELVTIIEGDGATGHATRQATIWLSDNRPGVAVEVHQGGQPLYPYLLGIE